jgi:hypothetical protein
MQYLAKFSFLFVLTLFFSACEKESSTKNLLIGADCWSLVKQEVQGTASGAWNSISVPSCEADNCHVYFANTDYVIEEGATKCAPNDPQKTTLDWSLSADNKTLTVLDGGLDRIETIESITETELVLVFEVIGFGKTRTTYRAN